MIKKIVLHGSDVLDYPVLRTVQLDRVVFLRVLSGYEHLDTHRSVKDVMKNVLMRNWMDGARIGW